MDLYLPEDFRRLHAADDWLDAPDGAECTNPAWLGAEALVPRIETRTRAAAHPELCADPLWLVI